jgi:hypothetical protein
MRAFSDLKIIRRHNFSVEGPQIAFQSIIQDAAHCLVQQYTFIVVKGWRRLESEDACSVVLIYT